MQCNINQRGRRVRMVSGIVCVLLGLVALIVYFAQVPAFALLCAGIVFLIAGAFQIFEARKGWCALRAMGMKTPV